MKVKVDTIYNFIMLTFAVLYFISIFIWPYDIQLRILAILVWGAFLENRSLRRRLKGRQIKQSIKSGPGSVNIQCGDNKDVIVND